MDDDAKDADELATEYQYTEVPCQRGVSGAQFSQGVQDFAFGIAAPQAWSPERSYFRAEVELLRGPSPGTGIPHISDGLALAEGAMNNAYTNAYFLAAGVSASNITNYLGVAAQLKARTQKTGAWLESIGKSWGMTASLAERIAAVSAVSATAGAAGQVGLSGLDDNRETIYRPIPFTFPGGVSTPPANFAGINVAVNAATGVVTGDAGVVFSTADVGATLVAAGRHFTIQSVTPPLTAFVGIFGADPANSVVATTDWYMVKRETFRSDQVRNRLQVLFRPPIGIMDYPGLLGAGLYRFQLSPNANFASAAVETFNPVLTSAGYTFNITDVRFYAAIVKHRIPDSVHTLHLKEYQIMSQVMNTRTQSFSFSVPASTTSLHIFLQDQAAGSSPYVPPSKFTVANGSDLNLERLQITYSNLTKPMTQWDSRWEFASPDANGNIAFLQQFYNQGLIENQMEADSAESFGDWIQRGPLYSFRYERDAADRSTDVQLQISYRDPGGPASGGAPAFTANSKVFLCACFDRAVEITHAQGLITGVRSLDV